MEVLKLMSEVESGAQACPKRLRVYPRLSGAATDLYCVISHGEEARQRRLEP
jgi:hypothetical protein